MTNFPNDAGRLFSAKAKILPISEDRVLLGPDSSFRLCKSHLLCQQPEDQACLDARHKKSVVSFELLYPRFAWKLLSLIYFFNSILDSLFQDIKKRKLYEYSVSKVLDGILKRSTSTKIPAKTVVSRISKTTSNRWKTL